MKSDRHHQGYTVLELLMALGLSSLTVLMAVPAFGEMERRNRARALSTEVVAGLHLARLSALQWNHEVRLCPSPDGALCVPDADWMGGFVVYLDRNRNARLDPDETILRGVQFQGERIRLASSSGRQQIRFRPDGSAYGSNATLLLCDSKGESAGAVIISNSGRVRVERRGSPQVHERCRP